MEQLITIAITVIKLTYRRNSKEEKRTKKTATNKQTNKQI